jgi:ferredoxin--NADP+ reductase
VATASGNRLGIPGENLAGSHAATEFVAWYNGHPHFADHALDLSARRAVVIGNGNVAIDARERAAGEPRGRPPVKVVRMARLREVAGSA